MQVNLRKRYCYFVFNEFPVDDLPDFTFHFFNPEYIVTEEENLEVEGGAAEIYQSSFDEILVGDIGMLECAFFQYPDHKIHVAAVCNAHVYSEPCFPGLVAPVYNLIGGYH